MPVDVPSLREGSARPHAAAAPASRARVFGPGSPSPLGPWDARSRQWSAEFVPRPFVSAILATAAKPTIRRRRSQPSPLLLHELASRGALTASPLRDDGSARLPVGFAASRALSRTARHKCTRWPGGFHSYCRRLTLLHLCRFLSVDARRRLYGRCAVCLLVYGPSLCLRPSAPLHAVHLM